MSAGGSFAMATKSIAETIHRFVDVSRANQGSLDEPVWNLSVIAVSNACERLVRQVNENKETLRDALLKLQNLIVVNNDNLKISVFLRATTNLLLLHTRSAKIHQSMKFVLSQPAVPDLVHPYVTILRQRSDLFDDISLEVDMLLDESYDDPKYLTATMSSFFSYILLSGDAIRRVCLLQQFSNIIDDQLRTEVHLYLVHTICCYPIKRNDSFYLHLVDYAMASLKHTKLHEADLQETATLLFYHLLNRACDAATSGKSISAILHRLQRIYYLRAIDSKELLTRADFYLSWTALSYLLAMVQTAHDQDILINMMHETVNRHPEAKGQVLLVAMLPLFQTWSETVEPSGKRKVAVLDLISHVGKHGNEVSDVRSCIENMQTIFDSFHVTGCLAHLASNLHRCLSGNDINQPIPSHTSSYVLALLFNTPLALSNDVTIRHQHLSRLAQIAYSPCSSTHSFRFPVFLLLLFLMRSHDKTSTESLIFIFHHILPSLVDPNDPTITSKILQLILPMIRGSQTSRDTVMSSIAFKVLVKLYERQPRIWQELKKVLANWTVHRKSMTNVNKEGVIRMELAVLSSMRDLCRTRARECAQDILPMLISLLQTCTNISDASITLIVQAISACVRAGLAEPRSIWTVAVAYIADYALQCDVDKVALLWKSLCEFFEIVGDKDEEPYIEFKETILHTYIEPLLASENETIRTAALEALSHFPAVDILQLLPEKSRQYTQEIRQAPNENHARVLVRLLSHELDHMRRALFQEELKKDTKDWEAPRKMLYDKEYQLAGLYIANWEQAKAAPGLRAGYAIAALFSAQQHLSDRHATTENMTKSKWYRCMTTSIADIGLTDNLLVRLSCLNGWITLFKTALGFDENVLDTKTHLLLKDLNARLDKSTVPGSTSSILLAMTGLILTVNKLNPALGATCASEVLDVFERYLADSTSTLSSILLLSEEVQFAANFAFGHVASCIVSNEKMATRILDKIIDNVTSNTKGRPLDSTIDIVQFARGYAAGHFTAALSSWPTQTPGIAVLSESGIDRLLDYCNTSSGHISESRALGIMMGWSSMIKPTEMKSVLSFAQGVLKTYIEGAANLNKGILLGSFWVCAYAAVTEDGLVEEAANILESAATLAETDPEMVAYSFLYSVPFARLNRYRMVSSVRDTEATPAYHNLMMHEMNIIESGDSAQKISAILTLGSLLGADYLTTDIEQAVSQIYKYHAESRLAPLNCLASLAGLEGATPVGNLKNGRVAAVVLGNIIGVAMMLRDAANSGAASAVPALTSSSTEPKNYSRLNNATSFLRAVFDTMVEIAPATQEITALKVFLTSLRDTPGPLPPVNWFNVLMDISGISSDLQILSIQFASKHASTSMSLSEFIIAQLDFKNVRDTDVRMTVVGNAGVGKVLELCGFVNNKVQKTGYKRRGMDAVTTKVTISGMRCLEIFGSLITSLKTAPSQVQLEFLSTLDDYLPPLGQTIGDETQADVVQHLRDMVYYNITQLLLSNATDVAVLRKAVDCSLVKNEQLSTEPTFANAVVIAEMCRLGRAATPSWITDTLRNVMTNIVQDASTWNELALAILASDCINDQRKLQWVIRLLDTLIVIGSDKSITDRTKLFANATQNGLRRILSMLWWTQADDQDYLSVPETEYMLSFALEVGNKYPTEQQQMMKRILTQMSRETALKPLFSHVLRNSPEKVLATQGDELAVLLSDRYR